MSHSNKKHCYEFGPFHLDLNKRVLSRGDETIALTPKATEILIMLVQNAGQLVEKDELLRKIWPDTFVEESNLTQNIFTLRKALGHNYAGPKYIETVTRRGYRFLAIVKAVETENDAEIFPPLEGTNSDEPIVAVLPFLNNTGNPELEYLVDGVTDNLINNLSRVSRLRVMSHSAISRYKAVEVDPCQVGRELQATAILIGQLHTNPGGAGISVEVVDSSTGWQLWGEKFDLRTRDLLQVQDTIRRQLLIALKLKLSDDEEKHVAVRYTQNGAAYQEYLEGRYHWGRYTRKGIEKAIGHFRQAIELDPNYALAYMAIIDCYLRLATNYLPPDEGRPRFVGQNSAGVNSDASERVRLRFEWDWRGVKRELRRADELKTNYPSAHQWYVAYELSKQLYRSSFAKRPTSKSLGGSAVKLMSQIPSVQLTPTEEIQTLCSVARDQIAIGNYEAARLVLLRWSTPGKWPKLNDLNPHAAADLLFTLGTLYAWHAATKHVMYGHKQAEIFLSGSIAIFEQLGVKTRSTEAKVELARCFYRQGLFDIARATLAEACPEIPDDELELKEYCVALWAAVEREAGRFNDALNVLRQAANGDGQAGNLDSARCHHELALTLKDLFISEGNEAQANEAKAHFEKALYIFEAVGDHRIAAAAENNLGFLLLNLGRFEESEMHLLHSKRMFLSVSDVVHEAQVKETLCRLYIKTQRYAQARQVIEEAIETLERTDGEAFLAEALRTAGIVAACQERYADAKKNLGAAYKVAERCGDKEGAGQALLIMFEEVKHLLDDSEKKDIVESLNRLLAGTQQTGLYARVARCVRELRNTNDKNGMN